MPYIDEILVPGQSVSKLALREYLGSREIARPEDYGAKGDGVHDDADAINQAILENKSIQLRACTYHVGRTVTLGYGCAVIGFGEATIIQARPQAYNSNDYIGYPSTYNAIDMVQGYSLVQNLRIVGGASGIKLYGRDGPCVKNVVENVSIWDAQIGICFDGWSDTNKPCYWNSISHVLIARPKTDGVLFTITPTHANDASTYGDTPNANKLRDVRVYSLSAPMSGFGFNVASARFANSFTDCEANVHTNAQACLRMGFNTDTNFIKNFYAESHGLAPGIRIDNGSINTSIENLFSATGGSAIWDPTLHGEYTTINAGYPYKNFLKKTWITDLYVEKQTYSTVFINPASDESGTIDLDLTSTIYLTSAFNKPVTLNLPNANDALGAVVTIKKTDLTNNVVTIKEKDGAGPDSRTVVLQSRYDTLTVISNGAQWWIVNETNQPVNSLYIQYSDTTSGVITPSMLHPIYIVSAFNGAIEFRLPPPNQAVGRVATIKKMDVTANHVTITQTGGGGPDAQAQALTSHFQTITIYSDGGQWIILSRY